MEKQKITDVASGTVTYTGTADVGSSTSSPKWSIKKTILDSPITYELYPISSTLLSPSSKEEFVWDDRANLTYVLGNALITIESVEYVDDTTILVTLSENADVSSITKANDGGFTVTDAVDGVTTYAVSAIAPGSTNKEIELTVADFSGSDENGLVVAYVEGGDGTVSDIIANLMEDIEKTIDPWA